jgi:hypothetical protein
MARYVTAISPFFRGPGIVRPHEGMIRFASGEAQLRIAPTTLFISALLAGGIAAGAARADDSSPKAPLSSKLNQQVDQAASASAVNGSSASDLNARVDELEATRSNLDQKAPSAVSLSVTGWVTQQVMVGKQ